MNIPKKYHHICNERSIDIDPDGTHFVWLNWGYCYEGGVDANSTSHSQGFDNLKDAVASLKYVHECHCSDCNEHTRGTVVGN